MTWVFFGVCFFFVKKREETMASSPIDHVSTYAEQWWTRLTNGEALPIIVTVVLGLGVLAALKFILDLCCSLFDSCCCCCNTRSGGGSRKIRNNYYYTNTAGTTGPVPIQTGWTKKKRRDQDRQVLMMRGGEKEFI